MTTYVAFLRGIMPINPNMRNAKICAVFESLGFTHVQPVIASGNIIFESSESDVTKLESQIENAIETKLKFTSTTFVRSKEYLEKIVKKNPFKGVEFSRENYQVVTFHKKKPFETFATIDISKGSPEFMKNLEKEHGKNITTRTWKTIGRILSKME